MANNGKPTVEVLTMHSSTDKQLPLTQEDFASIMGVAVAFIEKLPKGRTYPEWNWASWCNKYRGQLAMASEGQAVLVTALFNSLEVPGVAFHLWRESEIMVLTPVKLILDNGFMLSWIFNRNPSLEGTYHEVSQVIDVPSRRHVVHFKADSQLRASLAKLQTGSSTFYLRLGGQDRKAVMARDPLVVAEEAAELKGRIERALAKAIEASRPDLVVRVATPDHQQQQQQQQQGNYTIDYTKKKTNPNPDTSHNPGPSGVPKETEFARVWKLMEVEREQLEHEQKHQQEQHQRLQQHQQQQVQQFDNERLLLQQGHPGATTPIQQLQQQQGKANFSIIKYLTYNQNTSPPGVVKERVASFEAPTASPPMGWTWPPLQAVSPWTTTSRPPARARAHRRLSASPRPTPQPARPRSTISRSTWGTRGWTKSRPTTNYIPWPRLAMKWGAILPDHHSSLEQNQPVARQTK
jgi:hypothetical protein